VGNLRSAQTWGSGLSKISHLLKHKYSTLVGAYSRVAKTDAMPEKDSISALYKNLKGIISLSRNTDILLF